MENILIQYFQRITSLSKDEIKVLIDTMDIRSFAKGTFLVKEGQSNTNTFFILAGTVRQYKILQGDEITTNFFVEGQWIISLTGFSLNNVSTDNLICVEDTSVVVGNEQKAQDLFKQFPRLETVSRMVMENVFAEQQKMMSNYITDSPEQRYLRLLKTNPGLFHKVPQYHLASYIGVKPESLSRIRRRITQT